MAHRRAGAVQNALAPHATPPPAPEPIVTPPIYGTWPANGKQPVWLQDLNFDPRMRAAAGIAVNVVRSDQDDLIASAWDQFQQLRSVNQRLRQFQLARVTAQSIMARHINALEGAGTFLQLTRPLHTRVRLNIGDAGDLSVASISHTYCVGLDGARFPPPHPSSGATRAPAVPGGCPAPTDRRAPERGDRRPARPRRRGTAHRARRHGAVGHGLHRHTAITADDGGRRCRARLDHAIDRGAGSRAERRRYHRRCRRRPHGRTIPIHRSGSAQARPICPAPPEFPTARVGSSFRWSAIPRRGERGDLVHHGTDGADR